METNINYRARNFPPRPKNTTVYYVNLWVPFVSGLLIPSAIGGGFMMPDMITWLFLFLIIVAVMKGIGWVINQSANSNYAREKQYVKKINAIYKPSFQHNELSIATYSIHTGVRDRTIKVVAYAENNKYLAITSRGSRKVHFFPKNSIKTVSSSSGSVVVGTTSGKSVPLELSPSSADIIVQKLLKLRETNTLKQSRRSQTPKPSREAPKGGFGDLMD